MATIKNNVAGDALVRGWRTLYTGFIMDALILVGVGLMDLMNAENVDITSPVFWATVGILVGKSMLTAVASYLLRLKVTPANMKTLEPHEYSVSDADPYVEPTSGSILDLPEDEGYTPRHMR